MEQTWRDRWLNSRARWRLEQWRVRRRPGALLIVVYPDSERDGSWHAIVNGKLAAHSAPDMETALEWLSWWPSAQRPNPHLPNG
jgi:hypothetical protein